MNILFLGNGFDLHYSLPTSYTCFLDTLSFLQDHPREERYTIGTVFTQLLNDPNYTNSYISKSVENYGAVYDSLELPKDKINKLISIAKSNKWFRYLKKQEICGGGWIDFEREIGNVLSAISFVFELAIPYQQFSSYYGDSEAPLIYQKDIRKIATTFQLGDVKDTAPNPDAYRGSGLFVVRFQGKKASFLIVKKPFFSFIQGNSGPAVIEKNAIVSTLFKELQDFSNSLALYLELFVDTPLRILLQEKCVTLDKSFAKPDYVISLNYTKTYETLYNDNRLDEKRINHIHGTTDGPIVLGVPADKADEIDYINTDFLDFKKYYQRFVNQTDERFVDLIKYIRRDPKRTVAVFVFGHSLAETDKDIIRELFDVATKITVFFHNPTERQNYGKRLISIFGKDGFEDLRYSKHLVFIPTEQLNQTIINSSLLVPPMKPIIWD